MVKVTALVENRAYGSFRAEHGLCLHIQTQKHSVLFDVGPDDLLVKNSEMGGIDLSKVDVVVLSHGHMDHGGGLQEFLRVNKTARVYVQRKAFEQHYAKILFMKVDVGLDKTLKSHPQVVLLDGDAEIDEELRVFTVDTRGKQLPPANASLYTREGRDDFSHEQNLLIQGEKNLLVMGCGHAGVVNILQAAGCTPAACIGGYHLFNPVLKKAVPEPLLEQIAEELSQYDTQYYTCHCTGEKAFQFLSRKVPNMRYLSCGETIDI